MGLFNKFKEMVSKKDIKNNDDIETYDKGLEKTRKEFVSKLSLLGIKYTKIDEEYFEELENLLIMADIGVNTVMNFMDIIRKRVKEENITDTKYLNEVIIDELLIIYVNNNILSDKINIQDTPPTVVLMVGVNGVGKTTTIAKLAYKYKSEGKKVMMIGADTFRAGAVEQLKMWSEKIDCLFYGRDNSDPASVIFDGLEIAKKESADIVFIDTAGRLHNKVNLMNELEKINKVIGRIIPSAPHETLLVIDATTGQNGIMQAESFKSITNITGIVLTKLDGTAKGGIVLAIKESVNLPVKFIGLGEKMTDLKPFDIENYIYGLFDIYGSFINEKNSNIFTLYYEENLSMQEISEIVGVTKSRIGTMIKTIEKKLDSMEDKLGLYKKKNILVDILELDDINIIKDKVKEILDYE